MEKKKQEATYQGQCSTRVLRWNSLHKHVRLGGHNGWVDKSKKEEASDERANCIIGSFWVFALVTSQVRKCKGGTVYDILPSSNFGSAYRSTEYHTAHSPCFQ